MKSSTGQAIDQSLAITKRIFKWGVVSNPVTVVIDMLDIFEKLAGTVF